MSSQTRFSVKRFKSPAQKWFHPKLYLFGHRGGRRHALVGSSNMTAGGLQNNYEASLWSDEPGAVRRLGDYFDELFHGGHARPMTSLVARRLSANLGGTSATTTGGRAKSRESSFNSAGSHRSKDSHAHSRQQIRVYGRHYRVAA